MSYEILLLMNRIKAEQEKREQTFRIKQDTILNHKGYPGIEKVLVSSPCPLPDLRLFPDLKNLSISTMLEADLVSRMDFGDINTLSLNVNSFSGHFAIHANKLQSLRVLVSEVDKRLPLIDGNDTGIIDLSELHDLVEVSLHHVSSYTVLLPFNSRLNCLRVFNSYNIDLTPVMNNSHVVDLALADCDLGKTDFLEQFRCLEKLDISHNRIREALEILSMPDLRELIIRRNPLIDPERYRLPQLEKAIITERDYRVDSFVSTIKGTPYNAFGMINRVKDPEKVPPFVFTHYQNSSDEEIFTDYLVMGIASSANYYENPSWKKDIPLTRQETDHAIRKIYPYLMDRVRVHREKKANR